MASAISTHTFLCSSTRSNSFIFTSSLVLSTKPPKFILSTSTPQMGLDLFSPWTGLKQMGLTIRSKSVKIGRRGRHRGKFYASLFGVGAPEALVIGVVALLVFGPKGLAEVARNLGKTLRAFQPTIRELQDVSREFKSTLEREIGLDDLPPSQNSFTSSTSSTSRSSSLSSAESEDPDAALDPNGAPPINKPANIGEFLVAAQLADSTSQQLEEAATEEDQSETQPQPESLLQSESQTTSQPQSDSEPQSEVTTTIPEVVTTPSPEVITINTVTQTVETKHISSN